METLSRKGQANLRGYFDICDSLAENMIVVVNDEEGDSGSVIAFLFFKVLSLKLACQALKPLSIDVQGGGG